MIDYVVYLFGIELMEYRNCHGAIRQRGKEGYSPVGTVSAAKRHLIAFLYSDLFQKDVYLFYLAGHIVELKRSALVVGKGIVVPIQ